MHFVRTLVAMATLSLTLPAQAELIYGVKSPSAGSEISTPTSVLFSFADTAPTGISPIGNITLGGNGIDVDGLALSRSYGLRGFVVTGTLASPTSALIGIDAGTAVATLLGSALVNRNLRGGMFDALDRLWAVDSYARSLLRIDPTTGAILSEAAITKAGSPLNMFPATDLAQAADGTVYLSVYDADVAPGGQPSLFTLDLATGAASVAFVDLASDDELFGLPLYNSGLAAGSGATAARLFALDGDGQDDIFTYDLPGFARTETASNILGYFNAGGLDLASLAPEPVPEPGMLSVLAGGLLLARARRFKKG